MTKYLVKSLIWHTKDREHYVSGAIVSLDHLPQITIDDMVARGIFEVVEEEEPKSKPKAAAPPEEKGKE